MSLQVIRWNKRPLSSVLVFLYVLAVSSLFTPAGADNFSEREVRAVYLFNFSIFIRWPDTAFETQDSPFNYCVLGDDDLSRILARLLVDESVNGRPLRLLNEDKARVDWRRCHLLYMQGSDELMMNQVLTDVKGENVLTVADTEAFTRQGGMVGLVRKGRRIRPVINTDQVATTGIRISSKLLRLSTLVSADSGGASNHD